MPYRLPCVMAAACLYLLGCGGGTDPATSSPLAQVSLTAQSRSGRLTSQDVEMFLQLVARLPGERPPEPVPVSVFELATDLPSRQRLAVWRGEIRRCLEPQRVADSWKHGARVIRSLASAGVDPVDFAALMTRISTAWMASHLQARIDPKQEIASAEVRIESMLRELEAIERRLAQAPAIPAHWRTRQDALWQGLEQTVTLAEFLRLVEAVPEESRRAVQEHRTALARMLPEMSEGLAFERLDENTIQPAGFEETFGSPPQ